MTRTRTLVPRLDMDQEMRADFTDRIARLTVDSESRLTDIDPVHNLNLHRRGAAPDRFHRIREKLRS